MARGLRLGNRQFAHGARLGFFARRRWIDRGSADRRLGAAVDRIVEYGRMPPARRTGPPPPVCRYESSPAAGNAPKGGMGYVAELYDGPGTRDRSSLDENLRVSQESRRYRLPTACASWSLGAS